jgi:hypothetical protein
LGLSAQEQLALCENEALLTLAIEKTAALEASAGNNIIDKLKKKASNKKLHQSAVNGAQDEQCIIS